MQIDRMFATVYLLLERGTLTATELAERFEVSVRTVYRDIDALCAAGIPVRTLQGRGGGLSLMEGFVLDRSTLSRADQEQVLLALGSLAATGQTAAAETLEKVRALFRRTEPSWLEVDFYGWNQDQEGRTLFSLLRQAILEKQVICFAYDSVKGESTRRMAEPLKLLYRGQSWYLYAWCQLRGAGRFFKLNRIRGLQVCEQTFERDIPPVLPALNGSPNSMGEPVHLVLKAAPSLAHRVLDEMGTNYQLQADGSFLIQLDFPQSEWIWGYLLSFGEQLEVLEPEFIREGLRQRLIQALSIYET